MEIVLFVLEENENGNEVQRTGGILAAIVCGIMTVQRAKVKMWDPYVEQATKNMSDKLQGTEGFVRENVTHLNSQDVGLELAFKASGSAIPGNTFITHVTAAPQAQAVAAAGHPLEAVQSLLGAANQIEALYPGFKAGIGRVSKGTIQKLGSMVQGRGEQPIRGEIIIARSSRGAMGSTGASGSGEAAGTQNFQGYAESLARRTAEGTQRRTSSDDMVPDEAGDFNLGSTFQRQLEIASERNVEIARRQVEQVAFEKHAAEESARLAQAGMDQVNASSNAVMDQAFKEAATARAYNVQQETARVLSHTQKEIALNQMVEREARDAALRISAREELLAQQAAESRQRVVEETLEAARLAAQTKREEAIRQIGREEGTRAGREEATRTVREEALKEAQEVSRVTQEALVEAINNAQSEGTRVAQEHAAEALIASQENQRLLVQSALDNATNKWLGMDPVAVVIGGAVVVVVGAIAYVFKGRVFGKHEIAYLKEELEAAKLDNSGTEASDLALAVQKKMNMSLLADKTSLQTDKILLMQQTELVQAKFDALILKAGGIVALQDVLTQALSDYLGLGAVAGSAGYYLFQKYSEDLKKKKKEDQTLLERAELERESADEVLRMEKQIAKEEKDALSLQIQALLDLKTRPNFEPKSRPNDRQVIDLDPDSMYTPAPSGLSVRVPRATYRSQPDRGARDERGGYDDRRYNDQERYESSQPPVLRDLPPLMPIADISPTVPLSIDEKAKAKEERQKETIRKLRADARASKKDKDKDK